MLHLIEKECLIDLAKAKNVFNYILLKGQKLSDNHYSYLGLEAIHNFETCTLTLFDANVKLNFTLRGDYQTKLCNPASSRSFLAKIENIYQHHNSLN
ncbi:DUF3081 family protein [Neptuniibacter sp. SY11_33]|uniref:DUF3081 family protein n=1 Tax=Neptuniibacter sp. SY11_33 TaxID=3398215 RepID=UPI0039F56E1B